MPCPFIEICDEEVDLAHYINICCGAYRTCERYKEFTKQRKKPKEWKKELGTA